jgi:hypothetical protein
MSQPARPGAARALSARDWPAPAPRLTRNTAHRAAAQTDGALATALAAYRTLAR